MGWTGVATLFLSLKEPMRSEEPGMNQKNKVTQLEKKAEYRERLLEEAIRHFAKYGYANTVVNKIAKEVGLSNGVVFKYFESKENLLSEAYKYVALSTYPTPTEKLTLKERYAMMVRQTIQLKEENPIHFDFFRTLTYTSDLPDSYVKARRALFQTAPIYPFIEEDLRQRENPAVEPYDQFRFFLMLTFNMIDSYYMLSLQERKGNEFLDFVELIWKIIREDKDSE